MAIQKPVTAKPGQKAAEVDRRDINQAIKPPKGSPTNDKSHGIKTERATDVDPNGRKALSK